MIEIIFKGSSSLLIGFLGAIALTQQICKNASLNSECGFVFWLLIPIVSLVTFVILWFISKIVKAENGRYSKTLLPLIFALVLIALLFYFYNKLL